MLSVQEVALVACDEELAPVGVGSRVGHGQKSGSGMLDVKVFVGKLVAVDAHGSCTVTLQEIATLDHKILDDTELCDVSGAHKAE